MVGMPKMAMARVRHQHYCHNILVGLIVLAELKYAYGVVLSPCHLRAATNLAAT
jgi:hypothetical protein